jgi:hypothetical protein
LKDINLNFFIFVPSYPIIYIGGGPPVKFKYSNIEEAMLPLLSRTAVFGLPIPESEVEVPNAGEYRRCSIFQIPLL